MKNMKRVIAFVLLCCLTLPMVVMPTTATATAQPNEIVYDFDLGSTDLTASGKSFATQSLRADLIAGITSYYDAGTLNWKYTGISADHTILGNFGGQSGSTNYQWNGLRIRAKADGADSKNYYMVFTVRSPGSGEYYLTLDYQTHRYGASKGSVYLLPGNTADVAAAIAAGEAVLLVNYDNQSANAGAGVPETLTAKKPVTCAEGQEYLLVFTVDKPSKAGYGYLYIDQAKLTHKDLMPAPEEAPQLDQAVYDFQLEKSELTMSGEGFATKNLAIGGTASAVGSLYGKGSLNWKYHSHTADTDMMAYFGGQSGTKDYKWEGLRIHCRDLSQNYYIAMTIQSPGTGDYQVTVDYMVHRYGARKGNVYILPGDTADVAAAISSGKAVGTLNMDNGSSNGSEPGVAGRTTFSGTVPMEKGAEYIVVFESAEKGRNNGYLFLTKLTLTKSGIKAPADVIPDRIPEPEPIPEGSVIYDMDLADSIYKGQGKKLILDQIEDINIRYAKGSLNWGYAAHNCLSDASMAFLPTGGMVLYSYEMEWIAIKIKSPGQGLHTISLNHGVSGNGAIGAVYVLPVDTEDIEKAMDPSNRVGKVSYANEDGTPTVADNRRTVVGTWEFGSDAEYLVVFEAYQHTPFKVQNGYMFISQLIVTPGELPNQNTANRKVNSIVVEPGPIKICEATLYGTTAVINGSSYMFVPIEGKKVLAYNLNDKALEYEIKVPFTVPRGMLTDKNGIIWIVGDKPYLYRYDPITGVGQQFRSYKTADLAPGATSGFDLVEDEEGCLYFGTYNTGAILKFDPSVGDYISFGIINDDAVYPCGMAVRDGYLYSGIYGDRNADGVRVAEAVKIDTATGEVVARVDLDALTAEGTVMYRGAGLAGDLFLLGGEGIQKDPIAIDINTMELVTDVNINGGILYGVTEELNGKVYFVVNGRGLQEFDIATRTATTVKGLENVTIGIRCGKDNIVDVGDPVYPGWSVVTYGTNKAMPRIYNIEKGNIGAWGDLLPDNYGNATTVRTLTKGLPGSNELFIGAYNSEVCAVFNTATGKLSYTFEASASQTDAMVFYEGVLYTGNYNAGNLTRINLEDPNRNVILLSLKNDTYEQSRIHTLTAGDGKIFAGSTPDRYEHGGCLAWVDLDKMETYVERNVVQDQTINCIVYHDGYIYGTTSTSGGSGSAARPDLSAKLFVYDVANKKKVAEVSLEDEIPGLKTPIDFISGIAADPNIDENGKLWGLVSETLFSFTFNKTTGKVTVKEELSFDKTAYNKESGRDWFPRPFIFEDGYLYLSFDGKGGMRKINLSNVKDNVRIMPITPMFYTLGEDGNIYYLQDQSLMMYPLNVTEADWEAAEAVDAMIDRIGTDPITLAHESAITAAREAYNALSWKHKALVQGLEKIETAETDLLECKINTIGQASLDKKDLVYDLKAQYDVLPETLQRYVKNYSVLDSAYREINDKLDAQAAQKVQQMVDSIKTMGEIILEKEPAINSIREAYANLTNLQKQKVNIQALLDAEAKIRKLRDEKIEYLKQLITDIGEVTLEDEAAITEGMEIWDWLNMEEREKVDTATLTAANKQLTKLQKEAAAAVDALILAIGDTIDRSSKDAITAARNAYNALTPGSKLYVTQLAVLEEAEAIYAGIFPLWAIILIAVGGVLVLAGGAVATVLILKRKKAAAAEEPTTEPEA